MSQDIFIDGDRVGVRKGSETWRRVQRCRLPGESWNAAFERIVEQGIARRLAAMREEERARVLDGLPDGTRERYGAAAP